MVEEHRIYISSPGEAEALIMQIANFLRTGKNPKVSSVIVLRDKDEGGIYRTLQPNTTEFTFWTQGGGVVAVEDMDGDRVTKHSGPKSTKSKGANKESETTAL